jgi:rieske iron-sulfur protein
MDKARAITRLARRQLLKMLAAIGFLAPRLSVAANEEDALLAPQPGDWLVFAFGERAGSIISPEDLGLSSRQIFAYAMDPGTGVIRSASRLNQVLAIRLDPEILSEETRARSADGVVAYSGVCSHTGCDVTDWHEDVSRFQCPCHESQFDPADGARVVGGPAPWQLAALPLVLVEGQIAVAGEFVGRIGFMQPGLDPFGL